MQFELLTRIEPEQAKFYLTENKGIYFWFTKDTDTLVYIGVALGAGGLKKRLISQHLNEKYLEYRSTKHTEKDKFQLQYAYKKKSKDGKTIQLGIDKSSFRKSIGRKLKLKPGSDTVQYILCNLYIRIFESEDISKLRELEVTLIKRYSPQFNTSHNTTLKIQ
jgi:hypothetical protein